MVKESYLALLLDIDGTLTHEGRRQPSGRVVSALEDLRRRGIAVVLATGRTLMASRREVMGGFVPDYYICINGALVAEGDGQVLSHRPMSQGQFTAVLDLAERENCPLGFAFSESYYMYLGDEIYRPYYQRVNGDMLTLRDGSDRKRHQEGLPYAAFGILPPGKLERFRDPALGLHITAYEENVYDICQAGVTKESGAQALLDRLGLSWSDVLAVGDGENDVELLAAAGLGVAMGNAGDHVKRVADAVAPTVEEDGVLDVIGRYFPRP